MVYMPAIPVSGRQKADCHKLKDSLNYIAGSRLAREIQQELVSKYQNKGSGEMAQQLTVLGTALTECCEHPYCISQLFV